MKIDLSQIIHDPYGNPVTKMDGDPAKPKTLTFGNVMYDAVLANYRDENPSKKEKYARWKLAQVIAAGGNGDPESTQAILHLDGQQWKLVTDLVAKLYGPIVVGPFLELQEEPEEIKTLKQANLVKAPDITEEKSAG